jgi:oligopeptide/dipeptide ABC transporter ATP-binding protein
MSESKPIASSNPMFDMTSLSKEFPLERGFLKRLLGKVRKLIAVRNVSLSIAQGQVYGLVGESGSGKSTLAMLMVRLLSPTAGSLFYRGQDISNLSQQDLRPFRKQVQMVFQDTHSSLNPRKNVERTLEEALRLRGVPRGDRQADAVELLEMVGLGSFVLPRYPHQLSGGQRQRVAIARALAMKPEFLIADEPVASLDVSLQAQIINLLMKLREQFGLTMMFISHDLALVNQICNPVAVMYAGRIVELGKPQEVLLAPAHPYTQTLIKAIPAGVDGRRRQCKSVGDDPPDPANLPPGCPFVPRCPERKGICESVYPTSTLLSQTHRAECHLLLSGIGSVDVKTVKSR